MDALGAFETDSNSTDEEAMTEILDNAQEVAEFDRGKDVSAAENDDQSKEE